MAITQRTKVTFHHEQTNKIQTNKTFFFVYLMGMGYYYFHYNILLLLLLAPIFSVRLFLRFLGEFRRAPEALDSQPEKKTKIET